MEGDHHAFSTPIVGKYHSMNTPNVEYENITAAASSSSSEAAAAASLSEEEVEISHGPPPDVTSLPRFVPSSYHPHQSMLNFHASSSSTMENVVANHKSYMMNSFFALKLLGVTLFIVLVDVTAMILYYEDVSELQGNIDDDGCRTTTVFSLFVFHLFPINLTLGLTSLGFPQCRLFLRTKHGITRTLFLQLCELFAVFNFIFLIAIFIFGMFLLFNGGVFQCWGKSNTVFAFFAILVYIAIVVQLTWFTRFREHIKMQLGCFREKDQTGNIRSRIAEKTVGSSFSEMSKDFRKKIYKAATHEDIEELEQLMETCSRCLGRDFVESMYQEPYLWLGFFARSAKNPLHIAASLGNVEIVALLIKKGFQVNMLDKVARVRFSTSDLFWYFVNFIVKREMSEHDDGTTSIFKTVLTSPLHNAVASGRLPTVQYLLNHGANVNLNSKGSFRCLRVPPLFFVHNPDIAHLLIRSGANQLCIPDPGYMNTITALELAYLRGNYSVCQALEFWGGDIALTPLHAAAAMDKAIAVTKMLKMKANVNCLGEQGYIGFNRRTPLHWAAIAGSLNTLEVLLNAQANQNAQDLKKRTALHWACRHNHVAIVQRLVEAGADPFLVDCDGLTPLLFAAQADGISKDLVSSLVDAGVDVNYQLVDGDSALHIAVKNEHRTTAFALLSCGASIMLINNEGKRPIDCTISTHFQFELKKAAGSRDVMISYTHSHSQFAKKIRTSLEKSNVTTWMDEMDPSGIGGGAVWREEIARGISNAAIVLCILDNDYLKSQWCIKELAYAKQVGTPVVAISCEDVQLNEELQVYLYTRQMIKFQESIVSTNASNCRDIQFNFDEESYTRQFRLLLDGVRDEIEKRRQAGMTGMGQKGNVIAYDLSHRSFIENSFVFISHGDCHPSFTNKLYEALTNNGIICYADCCQEGYEMKDRIRRAKDLILKCSAFIVILSEESSKSEIVSDQLAFAEDKGKCILPILLSSLNVGQGTPLKTLMMSFTHMKSPFVLHLFIHLAQQYTLSRNEIYHFAHELGFASSLERLVRALSSQTTPTDTSFQVNNEVKPGHSFNHSPSHSMTSSITGGFYKKL